jgi:hypothetical protein
MKQLRTLKGNSKLILKGSELKAIGRDNYTRWTIVFDMLTRYIELLPFLTDDEPYWSNLLLSPQENGKVRALLLILTDFTEVFKILQTNSVDVNVYSVRLIFDKLIAQYPWTAQYLSVDADIVHSKSFEKAVGTVISEAYNELSYEEEESLQPFLKVQSEISVPDTTENEQGSNVYLNIVSSAKKRKLTSPYFDLKYLPPTSVSAERFFSRAKSVIDGERESLSELTFAATLFLFYNKDFWNIKDVDEILNKQK